MKLSFKFIKPWTWNLFKRKPKQAMIPVTAGAIAEVLFDDDDLYEQVTDHIEGMAMDEDDEEEEEPPSADPDLDDFVEHLFDDDEQEDFNEVIAGQLNPTPPAYHRRDVGKPTTIGDMISAKRRADFEDECG